MRAASNGPGFEKIIRLSKCVNEKELVLQLKKGSAAILHYRLVKVIAKAIAKWQPLGGWNAKTCS